MSRRRNTKAKPRTPPVPRVTGIDATPERMAKGDEHEIVPALIDSAQERQGKARKFQAAQLDRWHRAGIIDYRQWLAGDWYRQTHIRCRFGLSIVASYGERTSAGDHPGAFGYGLPRQEAAVRARSDLHKANAAWPQEMRGYMLRLLIHDTLPRYGGRQHHRAVSEVRKALDVLADHIRI